MPSNQRSSRIALAATILAFSLGLAACGDKSATPQAGGTPPPPTVAFVTVQPHSLTISNELPGRLEATRVSQVRARVPGIVLQRVFKEGSDVKAGDVLFRIDPASFKATYESSQASLSRAQANLAQASLKVQRYKPLVEVNAVSKQEYDDALTAQKQAQADVATAEAARQNAGLSLSYATVTAPISGRIGRALVTEGALVGQNEVTPLATIQQLDPIYVTLTQSSTDVLRLRQMLSSGKLKSAGQGGAKVTLVTEDGSVYPQPGTLQFSDMSVDESTGAVTLRAIFPNPQRFLLPGMFVRAQLQQAVDERAITVPQQAVIRNPDGASVMLVGEGDKAVARPVKAEASKGDQWVISEGLKGGERVIVEGLQKVKPGAPIKPVEWQPQGAKLAGAAPNPASAGQPAQPAQAGPGAGKAPPAAPAPATPANTAAQKSGSN